MNGTQMTQIQQIFTDCLSAKIFAVFLRSPAQTAPKQKEIKTK
jgi:hypothetical protein